MLQSVKISCFYLRTKYTCTSKPSGKRSTGKHLVRTVEADGPVIKVPRLPKHRRQPRTVNEGTVCFRIHGPKRNRYISRLAMVATAAQRERERRDPYTSGKAGETRAN